MSDNDSGNYDVVFCVQTGISLKVKEWKRPTKLVHYPMEWFSAHFQQRPTVIVASGENNIKDLRKIVKSHILNSTLTPYLATNYLIAKMKTITEKTSETWKSYGIEFGAVGTSVSPLSLITVSKTGDDLHDVKEVAAEEADDKWMMLYIVSIYHIINLQNETSRVHVIRNIRSKIFSHMPRQTSMIANLERIFTFYGKHPWESNKDFLKTIAAIDMFLHKFPSNNWSILRIGTITSRFRGCAALKSWKNLLNVLEMKEPNDLKKWLLCSSLFKEMNQLFKGTEEIDEEHSYFPYQLDFDLTTQTPYSSSYNNGLYFFTMAVSVMLGDERYKNAKMMLDHNIPNIMANVNLLSYVYSKDQTKQDEPISRDPKDWLIYFKDRKFKDKMKVTLQSITSKIENPRNGTIGKYLKDYSFFY